MMVPIILDCVLSCLFLGVFFVPYLLFLVLCGIPLFLLETSLGQYTSLGGVSAWRSICPLFGGKNALIYKLTLSARYILCIQKEVHHHHCITKLHFSDFVSEFMVM